MSKMAVIYWSMTGNTEAMAAAIAQGAQEAGAQLVVVRRPGEEGGSLEEVLSWLLDP